VAQPSGSGAGMNRAALQRQLQLAEDLGERLEENIAFQRKMIATLDRGGHDAKAAKMFLKWVEAQQAKLVAERDRLFKLLANSF
jgi:hypothetical protein